MAEPAYDYYAPNQAPATPVSPKPKKQPKRNPEMQKATYTMEYASYNQAMAVVKRIVSVFLIFSILAVFIGGTIYSFYAERELSHKIREVQAEYVEVSAHVETLRAEIEAKITASVVADYAENKLGMVKIPESNKVYSGIGTVNGVVNE